MDNNGVDMICSRPNNRDISSEEFYRAQAKIEVLVGSFLIGNKQLKDVPDLVVNQIAGIIAVDLLNNDFSQCNGVSISDVVNWIYKTFEEMKLQAVKSSLYVKNDSIIDSENRPSVELDSLQYCDVQEFCKKIVSELVMLSAKKDAPLGVVESPAVSACIEETQESLRENLTGGRVCEC